MNLVTERSKRLNKWSQQAATVNDRPAGTTETIRLCILGHSDVRLWGMSPATRLRRGFMRAGVTEFIEEGDLPNNTGPLILVRGDVVLDEPLIAHLVNNENMMILGDGPGGSVPVVAHVSAEYGREVAQIMNIGNQKHLPGIKIQTPEDLDADYWKALRKRETPYALIVTEKNLPDVLWRVFMGTYKGATDFVTKHLWPRPAFHATKLIAPLGITPNMVTSLSAVLVVLAFYLFMQGHFGWGLVAAWMMTFLDTVDGKLARVTLTSSPWGNVFDHGIDLIHPPFWYWAWGAGISLAGTQISQNTLYWWLAVIVGGYILQRVLEGLAIAKLGLEIHIWRPVDTFFRQITARRNPNLALLTIGAIVGAPDYGLLAVAGWTLICLGLHLVQFLQAWQTQRKTGSLSSWLTKPADAP